MSLPHLLCCQSVVLATTRPYAREGVCPLPPLLTSLPPVGQRHYWWRSSSTKRKARCIVVIIAPSLLFPKANATPHLWSSKSSHTLPLSCLRHHLPTSVYGWPLCVGRMVLDVINVVIASQSYHCHHHPHPRHLLIVVWPPETSPLPKVSSLSIISNALVWQDWRQTLQPCLSLIGIKKMYWGHSRKLNVSASLTRLTEERF